MVVLATSHIFRRITRIILQPVTCSLCRRATSGYSYLESISQPHAGDTKIGERDRLGLESDEKLHTDKVLGILNTLSESELKTLKYINSKVAGGIIAYREKHGMFRGLDDFLAIPGIGRRTLDKLTEDFTGVKPEKGPTRIETQSNAALDLTRERLENLQDIVSIDVGLKYVAWAHMDRQRWVHQWQCHQIEGISPGKYDPINYLRLISNTIEELPRTNLYVLEHRSFTSLNKGTFQTLLFVRCLESMFYTSLNHDLRDSGELKAISLPQNVVGKHFGLLVGAQRKSGQVLLKKLLQEGTERRNAWFSMRIGHDSASTFDDSNRYEREHLANCMLRAVAFYDIYVDKKSGVKM